MRLAKHEHLSQTMNDAITATVNEPHSSPVAIGPVRFRELRAVARVQRHSFRPGLAYNFSALALLWLLPSATFFVARDARTGEVLGCCITDRQEGRVRIVNIAVIPAARRRGIATALLRQIAAAEPNREIELIVEERNEGAQALYRREGFVRTGFARDYYGTGNHGIWMRRPCPVGAARRRTIDV